MNDVAHRVEGSVVLVEISRPDRANALRRRTIRELGAALDAAEAACSELSGSELSGSEASGSASASTADTGVSGVVVTGGGRFSAGADLSELAGTLDDLGFDDELERLCHRLTHSPLPVVAAVEGACYGAAVDLAWACDAVVVSSEARLAVPSTSLGILYNPVSVARLHARLGSSTARRLMVLQQELSGRELPHGSAIVTEAGTTVETAKRIVRSLSAPNSATAATKALLAALDSGAEFEPAAWQAEREARLASPARLEALVARKASMKKEPRA